MNILLKLEDGLIRAESWLLVATVITMLVLGSYNVLYRNVLAPWQRDLATSGPPVAAAVTPTPQSPKKASKGDDSGGGFGGGFGSAADDSDSAEGFAGGFGEDAQEPGEDPPADPAGGFGGGFGTDDAKQPSQDKPDDEAGGFAGGFGGNNDEGKDEEADGFAGGFGSDEGDDDDGFGGGFGAKPKAEHTEVAPALRAPQKTAKAPEGGPPEPGSFAASAVVMIDSIKLEWVDTLLRQLVIIVGFLGAMIATRRRKHINIDAASKLLPMKARGWVAMAMNILSTGVSIFLAIAGYKLVAIGKEFPKELMPYIEEWHMQLMFPLGFGLLAFHFALRSFEDLNRNLQGLPPMASGETAELENERALAAAQTTEEVN